jgi:hypothetical protein
MRQLSHHKIQLNAVAPLVPVDVTELRFEVFKVGALVPVISKSLGSGIVENATGWQIDINAAEIDFYGQVYREVYFVANELVYRKSLGFSDVEKTLITI